MPNPIKKLVFTALALCLTLSARAFTLLGPFDAYQTAALDYGASPTIYAVGGTSDLGGPQNLGEWYRWNTPRLYYAYDASFVDYFGSNGVRSIEQAIALFNALPAVSQMTPNLTEFPLDSHGQNYTAYALGLLDLKSVAVSEILAQIGLWNPTRFTWTPLAKYLPTGAACPAYDVSVIMRNFDPITWNPSAYVNNKLYTFVLYDLCTPTDAMDAVEETADPTAIGGSAAADEQTSTLVNPGVYFNGLTRDDAGGLRYLLSRRQVAVESLTGGAVLGNTAGTALPSATGATPNNSPWNLAVAITLTNATILGNGSPWSIISFNSSTNTTNSLVITNITTTTTSNGGPFNVAGVEKITFIQVPFDSTIGINYTPFVDRYALTMYNKGQVSSQAVTRTVAAPDIVFAAGNLGVYGLGMEAIFPVMISRNNPGFLTTVPRTATHVNNGPGTINPSSRITFSDIGPWQTIASGVTTLGSQGLVTYWGSFSGDTNAPVVYPSGASIQQIESRLFP